MVTSINEANYPSMVALRAKYRAEGFEANLAKDAFDKMHLVIMQGSGNRLEFTCLTEAEAKAELDELTGADMLNGSH